jgi:hypothetical protein
MTPTEDAVAAALASVDALATLARQAAGEWIPAFVKDGPEEEARANPPPDERQVLCFIRGDVASTDVAGRNGDGHGIRLGHYDHDKGRWRAGYMSSEPVTHWMELPAAPTPGEWPPVLP